MGAGGSEVGSRRESGRVRTQKIEGIAESIEEIGLHEKISAGC